MGNITSHINGILIQYLKTLKTGSELYSVKKYEQQFMVDVNLPKVKMIVLDFFIIAPDDFVFGDSADLESSVNVKSPLLIFKIGEAALESAGLGPDIRVSGKVLSKGYIYSKGTKRTSVIETVYKISAQNEIKIHDVQLKTVITPSFENGLRIAECDPTVKVKKIKFELHLSVNGRDHSPILNLILSAVSPEIVTALLNFLLNTQKGNIRDQINKLLEAA